MHQDVAFPHAATEQRLRLDTLVRLRWLLVLGQFVAVLIGWKGLDLTLPLPVCFGLTGVSAALNVGLRLRFPATQRLTEEQALPLLGFDGLQLAALLHFTGGLSNPFALLLIAPVVVAATVLSAAATLGLGVLVALLGLILAVTFEPLVWASGQTLTLPPNYILGMWVALVLAGGFVAAYSFRVAEEARRLQAALAATEMVLMREQHLNQLDGLAAAAAHELGTPLGTITLVTKEMLREVGPDSRLSEDLELLRSQAERCREILRKLTSLNTDMAAHFDRLPLSHLIEDMTAPHRDFGVDVVIQLDGDRAREPQGGRNPAILYGLGNILENAMDFANARVDVAATWTEERVAIVIRDDGPGFAPEILARIGDPYVTTRQKTAAASTSTGGGLGLGFFIAKTLLERTGARLTITNRAAPEHGAVVRVEWPRSAMEVMPQE
ncbi:ActS/PrrB/RegB family redox-sensitive histidine kinase [Oryzibacter oryziterrae]|uniref:ActS/PrrB/RegB family redox-sensitive histidine kinase n=1 Tax=Oryzibacter oryziterrae TaxID=2766474 RepID=UPI001EFFA3FE|nr:ActS/PrrB/RegB family redox-sensitive histidine kinase [Oryzibacter oryziterrae]